LKKLVYQIKRNYNGNGNGKGKGQLAMEDKPLSSNQVKVKYKNQQ